MVRRSSIPCELGGWTVLVFVVFAYVLGGGWPVAAARAAPGASPREFQRHATRVAARKKLVVCRWGQLRYQKRGRPGFFAVFANKKSDRADVTPTAVLFGRGDFERWDEPDETFSLNGTCDGTGEPMADGVIRWEDLPSLTIHMAGGASYRYSNDTVSFVDGELVQLEDDWGDVDGSTVTSWTDARRQFAGRDDEQSGREMPEYHAGLLVVLPAGSPWLARWRSPTFVTFGAKNRRSRADADIAVKAVEAGADTVSLVVDIKDDRLVPVAAGADAKQFLRGDHLELWWRYPGSQENVQLGVGLSADGGADVRWLRPPPEGVATSSATLPAVRRAGPHVEIDLPIARLAERDDGKASWTAELTVAFSDADDPAAGQQTVVATSMLRWNQTETFGELARFDTANRRFPSF